MHRLPGPWDVEIYSRVWVSRTPPCLQRLALRMALFFHGKFLSQPHVGLLSTKSEARAGFEVVEFGILGLGPERGGGGGGGPPIFLHVPQRHEALLSLDRQTPNRLNLNAEKSAVRIILCHVLTRAQ